MKLKFIWNMIKGFINNMLGVFLIFIAIVLYAIVLTSITMLFNDDKLLLLFMTLGLYLIACFIIYVLINYESIKKQYNKAKENDSKQVIERSYTVWIKVKGSDIYSEQEIIIDTADKTHREIRNEVKDRVFECLSWGYKIDE